jgi:CheY-like chemotaxis protein
MKGAGERESRNERLNRDYQEILRVEAATRRTARSGGVSGMLHRTTVRRGDLIEGTVDWKLNKKLRSWGAEIQANAERPTLNAQRRIKNGSVMNNIGEVDSWESRLKCWMERTGWAIPRLRQCVDNRQLSIPIPRRSSLSRLVLPRTRDRVGPEGFALEDRDDFREVLRDHMVSHFFQVTSVPSGVEGLREIRKGAFDLIICDMMMLGMGGEMFYWAVTRIRPATAQRFIFFTGHRNNPAIEFFFKRVKATVLIKPFSLKTLDSTIRDVLLKLIWYARIRASP